jgi:RIO kinase 1
MRDVGAHTPDLTFAHNSARAILIHDIGNITATLGKFAPDLLDTRFAEEMWALFEQGELRPESTLSGLFAVDESAPDVDGVLSTIDAAREEALRRQFGREEADSAY